jgi:hypothetical protein
MMLLPSLNKSKKFSGGDDDLLLGKILFFNLTKSAKTKKKKKDSVSDGMRYINSRCWTGRFHLKLT